MPAKIIKNIKYFCDFHSENEFIICMWLYYQAVLIMTEQSVFCSIGRELQWLVM